MNELNNQGQRKKESRNIVYILIGIFTLIIAISGATYAYFAQTDTINNAFTGNMATITFNIAVEKKSNVDNTRGLIPMTNSMVEKGVSEDYGDGICLDDNGNAVCQVYKITINNSSTASMFFDGYVTLTGGSGEPTDDTSSPTTMRWAQAFCTETSGALTTCTTAGASTVRQTEAITWTALGSDGTSKADSGEILKTKTAVAGNATIQGNSYSVINTNYIRISNHTGSVYKQADDVTSALVYNQYLSPNDNVATNNSGGDSADSNTTTTGNQEYVDAQVYYIVVWLSETGHNQTAGSGGTDVPSSTTSFFQGTVTFTSAQGSEVTAMFGDYATVTPDTMQPQPN